MSDFIKTELQKFSITDAAIAKLSAEFLALKVKGLDDKEGLTEVHSARMVVRARRIEVEKKRKELKESSLSFGRAVDGEAKRITALLLPIETHLENEESIIEKEKERLALEAVQKRQVKLQERANKLKAYECAIDAVSLSTMPDDVFEKTLANAAHDYSVKQQKHKEALEAIEKVKAVQEQERIRLVEIAKKHEQEVAAQKAAFAIITEKQMEAIAQEQVRLATIAKQQAENEARIKIEAKKIEDERLAKETRLAIEKEKKEQEAYNERLKPDYEKLSDLANTIACISMPTVISVEAKEILIEVQSRIEDICDFLAENIA